MIYESEVHVWHVEVLLRWKFSIRVSLSEEINGKLSLLYDFCVTYVEARTVGGRRGEMSFVLKNLYLTVVFFTFYKLSLIFKNSYWIISKKKSIENLALNFHRNLKKWKIVMIYFSTFFKFPKYSTCLTKFIYIVGIFFFLQIRTTLLRVLSVWRQNPNMAGNLKLMAQKIVSCLLIK